MGLFGSKKSRVAPVIQSLSSPNEVKIERAKVLLGELLSDGLKKHEVQELFEAAIHHASHPYEETDLCQFFIAIGMGYANHKHLAFLFEHFTELSNNGRRVACELVLDLPPNHDRIRFLAALIHGYQDQDILPAPFLEFEKLIRDPQLANEFLKLVAPCIESKEFSHNIYMFALELLNQQVMAEKAFNTLMEHAIPHYISMAKTYVEIKDNPRWKFTEDGYHLRHFMPRSLDVISHGPGEFAGNLVMASFSHPLAEEKIVALRALLQRGFEVPEETLHELMEDTETRAQTYQYYQLLEQLDLLPEPYTTLEALAEGAITHWLSDPDEFKNAPDELELMQTFKINGKQGSCFLYRFKCAEPHWKAESGWIAGLVGPLDPEDPDPMGGELIGTAYTPWDEASPKEHIKALAKHAKNPQRLPGEIGDMFAKMDNMLKDLEAQAASEEA